MFRALLILGWATLACIVLLACVPLIGSYASFQFNWMNNVDLCQILGKYSGYWLTTLLVCIITSLYFAKSDFSQLCEKSSAKLLLFILIAGAILLNVVVVRTNRLFFDEQIYQQIAQHFSYTGELFYASHADIEYGTYNAFGTVYAKQPQGHPFFMGMFFRMFGTSESVAHLVNNLWYFIGIGSVFLLASLCFTSGTTGVVAAAYWAGTPMVLHWANTTSSDVPAAVVVIWALVATAMFERRRTWSTLVLWVCSNAFAASFRPETILIVPTSLLYLALNKECRKSRWFLGGLSLLLVVGIPNVLHFLAVKHQDWGAGNGQKFALENLTTNFRVNFDFLYDNMRYPALLSGLALIGFFSRHYWRPKVVMLVWFCWSWGLFLFFYAGSYNYGQDVRFSVSWAAIFALLAAHGTIILDKFVQSRFSRFRPRVIVCLSLLACLTSYFPLLRAVGYEMSNPRAEVEFAKSAIPNIPRDSLVLGYVPSTWLIHGVNAQRLDDIINNPQLIYSHQQHYKGGVYLYYDFWCEPHAGVGRTTCDELLRQFPNHILYLKTSDKEPLSFALYKFESESE